MVEMLLVVSMTALIVGAVTAIYAYTVERLGNGLADARTQRQAEYGLDVVDTTINKAQSCSLVYVSGVPCVKCTMPANCSDANGDGILDTCTPDAINRRSLERWGNGYRVWFYMADATGVPGVPGSLLWMAQRTDDGTPTSVNTVAAYTYFPGNTKVRLDLIQSLTSGTATFSNEYTVALSVGAYTGQGGAAGPRAPRPARATSSV